MCIQNSLKLMLSAMTLLSCLNFAHAVEPPTQPILSIDSGEHTALINRIATDAQGRWLATASNDKTIRLWSLTDGRLLSTLRPPLGNGNEGQMYNVAISPDGSIVAAAGWTQFNNGLAQPASEGSSIYLFDRASGRMLRRLSNLPNIIADLTFSPDGRWLAATLKGNNGVRVFDAASGKLLAEDSDYGGESSSANFSGSDKGETRVVTTSYDGFLRLYRFDGNHLILLAKRAAPGGKIPVRALFSPDGKRIAVSFADAALLLARTGVVNVLDSDSLALRFAPDTDGINDSLAYIAWSHDGAALFAAHTAHRDNQFYVRRWSDGGAGTVQDWPVSGRDFRDIVALPDGRLAFTSTEPAWGVVDATGQRVVFHAPTVADLRGSYEGFRLSSDGAQVRFGYEAFGKSPAVFDILHRDFLRSEPPNLVAPRLKGDQGLEVTDWNSNQPKVNGNLLRLGPYERSLSLALWPNGESFALGTDYHLFVAGSSAVRWALRTPFPVWGVNVSADGRWVVAAHGDGTIRWHRATDGVEQLAFYPHPDKKRWIMWTPEGYYDASPGGEDLIGWHLNQGKEKEARFISNSQLYDVFFRPDIVQAKFRGEDISGLITLTAAQALKNPPPILSFTKVPSATQKNMEKVCYKVVAAGGGIGEVRLFQNGKLIKSDGFYRETVAKGRGVDTNLKLAAMDSATVTRALKLTKAAQKAEPPMVSNSKGNEFEECQEIETIPGDNEISVAAFNGNNTVQSKLETSHFVANRKAEEAQLYVLGIGINQYRDADNNLKYAVKDATDFRTMISAKAEGLFDPKNVHIEGLSNAQATKAGIQKAIHAISAKVKPWDSFILFVASHGALLDNQYYIVTADFDGTINTDKMISSNEIVGMSKNIKSLSQLLIFDTCHAGGVDNIIGGLYDARMSVMAKKMGLHIYASAGSTQTALDGYQGNGLFTHALLRSMKVGDTADSNHDKEVTVAELGEQAKQETMDISEKLGFPQSPNIINFGKDNALFRVK